MCGAQVMNVLTSLTCSKGAGWRGIVDGLGRDSQEELVIVRGTFTAFKLCEQIVCPYVVPFFKTHNAMIFQEDNARPQSANSTCQVLAKNHVATLEWPSRSADLSPIEHVWDILGRRIYARNDANNIRQLEAALLEE